ncbi:TPA: hypothetical protein OO109_002569 [Legionella pneumophila]|nr:hypothetical protein [Legionella pneumophila]HCR5410009.1 hypothetical protein [Legionella pneumophila]HDV5716697.1 hypothetical protein [Legionella pneumophila]
MISRRPLIWSQHVAIENLLYKFAFIANVMSLVQLNGIAGFIWYLFLNYAQTQKITCILLAFVCHHLHHVNSDS